MRVTVDDLRGPEIAAFLQAHLDELDRVTPAGSRHRLDLDGLRRPEITFWSARDGDGTVLGTGALRQIDHHDGEIKSMRTSPSHRRRGVASAVLRHIEGEARGRGLRRLVLDTGSPAFFEPARRLYRAHGYRPCGPFGDHWEDPNLTFMSKSLVTRGREP